MATLVGFLKRVQREDEENVRRGRRLPRQRVFRDRINPLDLRNDEELFERYRFRRPTIFFLCQQVENSVRHPTVRSLALSQMVQLQVFLRFVATGAFQQLVGDANHISKSAAGSCIRRVASAFANLAGQFIKFPTGQEAANTKRKFHSIAGKDFVGYIINNKEHKGDNYE